MSAVLETLRKVFGFDSFRPLQKEAVQAVVNSISDAPMDPNVLRKRLLGSSANRRRKIIVLSTTSGGVRRNLHCDVALDWHVVTSCINNNFSFDGMDHKYDGN